MHRRILLPILFFVATLTLTVGGVALLEPAATPPRIAILHFHEIPALTDTRDGFIAALRDARLQIGEDVVIDEWVAHGDPERLVEMAAEIVAAEYDLILALGTLAVSAVAERTETIPILFAGVRDPVEAKIVESLDSPGRNVTGSSHWVPVEQQIRLIPELLPRATRIGVLYNPLEPNAVIQVNEARAWAAKQGVTLVEQKIGSVTELAEATVSLADVVDVIYLPTDSTVVAGVPIIIPLAEQAGVPVIASDRNSVRRGAVAAYGADETMLGRATGQLALRILFEGADPGTLPVVTAERLALAIHLDAARRVGLTIPDALLSRAEYRYVDQQVAP